MSDMVITFDGATLGVQQDGSVTTTIPLQALEMIGQLVTAMTKTNGAKPAALKADKPAEEKDVKPKKVAFAARGFKIADLISDLIQSEGPQDRSFFVKRLRERLEPLGVSPARAVAMALRKGPFVQDDEGAWDVA